MGHRRSIRKKRKTYRKTRNIRNKKNRKTVRKMRGGGVVLQPIPEDKEYEDKEYEHTEERVINNETKNSKQTKKNIHRAIAAVKSNPRQVSRMSITNSKSGKYNDD